MDTQDYWTKKHAKYSREDWIKKPSLFAAQVIKFFPSSGHLLDLGAGQGQDSVYFADHGYQVLATDFSPFALDQITDPRIQRQLIDLSQALPLPPASFDIVYSHMSLHYFNFARTQTLFDEIFTLLKPGGVFATLTNSLDDPDIPTSTFLEPNYYISGSIPKRYFSVTTLTPLVSKFETLLLDNHGQTYKDQITTLIRFVGRKP